MLADWCFSTSHRMSTYLDNPLERVSWPTPLSLFPVGFHAISFHRSTVGHFFGVLQKISYLLACTRFYEISTKSVEATRILHHTTSKSVPISTRAYGWRWCCDSKVNSLRGGDGMSQKILKSQISAAPPFLSTMLMLSSKWTISWFLPSRLVFN